MLEIRALKMYECYYVHMFLHRGTVYPQVPNLGDDARLQANKITRLKIEPIFVITITFFPSTELPNFHIG